MILLIDVHPEYQPEYDFDGAYVGGARGAFLKTSEGVGFVPRGFTNAARRMRASRLIDGYYHFLTDTHPGAAQADFFVRTIRNAVGTLKGCMLAVDYESSGGNTAGDRQLKAFIARLRQYVPNRPIVVYSGYGFWTGREAGTRPSPPLATFGDNLVPWDARVAYSEEKRKHPRDWHDEILAWYKRQPTWGGWTLDKRRRFWQFTWGGLMGGQYVDCDAFYGDYSDLQAIAGLGDTVIDEPDPEPTPKPSTDLERRVEHAIAFALAMRGTPYGTGWRAGTWPALSPLYSHITRHDPASWYRQRPCICSGLINVVRFEAAELPSVGRRAGDGWPGGMAAIGRHLAHAPGSKPYPLRANTPRGWLVYSPYLGTALALQGHIAIALGNGFIVESRVPSASSNRTEDDMHRGMIASGGTGNTRIIPPELWLR